MKGHVADYRVVLSDENEARNNLLKIHHLRRDCGSGDDDEVIRP